MPRPRPLTPAQYALQDSFLDRVQTWVRQTSAVTQVTSATVASVTAAAASDGNSLAVVTWQGTDVAAPYLSSYTPVVGHVVAVAKTGSQLLILGRIIGTP